MRHGLILVAPSIADQIEAARYAEARGFDSVWVTEFFNHHGFVRLAAVAGATERVQVGTAIAYGARVRFGLGRRFTAVRAGAPSMYTPGLS